MSTRIDHKEIVSRYFEGTLTAEEMKVFQQLMADDADAQREYGYGKLMKDVVTRYAFQEKLDAYHKAHYQQDAKDGDEEGAQKD